MLVLLHVPRRDMTAMTGNSTVSVVAGLDTSSCVGSSWLACLLFLVCLALFALCLPVFSFVPSVPKPLCAFLRVCACKYTSPPHRPPHLTRPPHRPSSTEPPNATVKNNLHTSPPSNLHNGYHQAIHTKQIAGVFRETFSANKVLEVFRMSWC